MELELLPSLKEHADYILQQAVRCHVDAVGVTYGMTTASQEMNMTSTV
jgi:hypothetical protein